MTLRASGKQCMINNIKFFRVKSIVRGSWFATLQPWSGTVLVRHSFGSAAKLVLQPSFTHLRAHNSRHRYATRTHSSYGLKFCNQSTNMAMLAVRHALHHHGGASSGLLGRNKNAGFVGVENEPNIVNACATQSHQTFSASQRECCGGRLSACDRVSEEPRSMQSTSEVLVRNVCVRRHTFSGSRNAG